MIEVADRSLKTLWSQPGIDCVPRDIAARTDRLGPLRLNDR